jgi:hypothetical protein
MMSILESSYGHVVERLLPCWGDPVAFQVLFDDLMFDARGGRSGWPTDVWGELQFLERLHKLAYSTLDEEKEEPTDDAIKWV